MFKVGDRVIPTEYCLAEFGGYYTRGEAYEIGRDKQDTVDVVWDNTYVYNGIKSGYLPMQDKYFKLNKLIHLGGE